MEGSIAAAPNDIENPHIFLETSLKEELQRLSFAPMSNSRSIFRIPSRLRVVCGKAYTPQVVSVGPFHHGKEALKAMEEHKMRYLQYFLGRRNNLSLTHYIEKIKNKEEQLRRCYSETIELNSDEFVKIILVDAIFLIEFLFRNWYPELLDQTDCIFGKPNMVDDVFPDLLLLENQLPFFILEDLFDPHIFPESSKYWNSNESLSIMFLSYSFLNDRGIYIGSMAARLETISCSKVKIKHFVHMLRKLYTAEAPILNAEATKNCTEAPTIEELHRAGVKFRVGSGNNLFDIRFKYGILEIPKLKVVDQTELILRNLVAYEQCLCGVQGYTSHYVCMMDKLVDTPKDVALLAECGIVKNSLGGGNVELATMINSISTGVGVTKFSYTTICEDLNKYCSSPRHRSIANLRQNYFNTPWATISFIAAVLILILTAIQTICSIVSL